MALIKIHLGLSGAKGRETRREKVHEWICSPRLRNHRGLVLYESYLGALLEISDRCQHSLHRMIFPYLGEVREVVLEMVTLRDLFAVLRRVVADRERVVRTYGLRTAHSHS